MRPIPTTILNRKGSPTTAGVPAEVRRLLDEGRIETVNLSEWLIVDQAALAARVFQDFGWEAITAPCHAALAALVTPTAPRRFEAIGRVLAEAFATSREQKDAIDRLRAHPSDIVRSWAAYLLGQSSCWSLAEKTQHIRALAADHNMSVRETAWLSVRETLASDIATTLRLLAPFVRDADPNVRRFASEATRPRGVWCRHIQSLKDDPSPALPLLEPLRSDTSKYVRDSVANWLNDASKSRPEWVQSLCARWLRESPTAETKAIAHRALRTLRKAATKPAEA
jgi:3-methyladenine DNA glycosylase AlkC